MEKQTNSFKIAVFSKLSQKRLSEAKRLVALCKRKDGFEPIFYWSSIENRRNPGIHEILCYTNTSPEKLVGYLAIYHFEAEEVEVTVAIHPDYQDENIDQSLLDEMKRRVEDYPVEIKRYVFTCHEENLNLKTYLSMHGAKCSGLTRKLILTARDYQRLKLRQNAMRTEEDKIDNSSVQLRMATEADISGLVQLGIDCYGGSEQDYSQYLLQALQDPAKIVVVACEEGDKIIGKIHAHLNKKEAHVYDLCVSLDRQNRGYGGILLSAVLQILFDEKATRVLLDVSDQKSFNWYETFNFQCVTTYEHWKLPVFEGPLEQRVKHLETLMLNYQSYQVQDEMSRQVYKH